MTRFFIFVHQYLAGWWMGPMQHRQAREAERHDAWEADRGYEADLLQGKREKTMDVTR